MASSRAVKALFAHNPLPHPTLQDAHFEARGSASIFKSWRLDTPHLALHLSPKPLAQLLRAAAAGGALVSTLTLSVGPSEDRLTLQLSSLSKHGIAQRARYDLALLTPAGECARVDVDAAQFEFTAQVLCTQPAILADALAQLKAAGCQEVRLTLAADTVTFASVGPELPINCEWLRDGLVGAGGAWRGLADGGCWVYVGAGDQKASCARLLRSCCCQGC